MAKRNHKRNNGSGTLIRRGKTWYARWMHDGRVYAKTTGCQDKQEAEQKLKELTAPFRMGSEIETLEVLSQRIEGRKAEIRKYEDEKPSTEIQNGWAAYLSQSNRPDSGDSTLHQYEFQYEAFASWMAVTHADVTELRHVTQEHADLYASHLLKKLAPTTFNKHMNLLALMWRVLEKRARLIVNPWKQISRKRSVMNSRRELTIEELGRVCESTQGEMRQLIALGIYCGLRLGDAACLKWSSVDMVKGVISLIPMKTARRAQKRVNLPIHPTLLAMLSATPLKKRSGYVMPGLAERYTIKGALSRDVAKLYNSVGIETTVKSGVKRGVAECGFHSLRHTFVSLCAAGGVPQSVVQSLVGHGSPAMTAHYTHIGLETAQNAVAVLPDVTHGSQPLQLAEAAGTRLASVTAMLDQLTVDELEALYGRVQGVIKKKRAQSGSACG